LSRLVIPKIECVESGGDFGRALLSYLPGAAVTRVKIEGIQHEFTIIPHAKEDAMEFLLNVKALRLKPLADRPGKLTLDVQGEGRVCAADIKPSTDFEIVNPELCLVSLDSPEAKLYVEFDVELGEGYRPAEASDSLPVGVIPVDAIFTPIRKINFTTEPVHIGQETSHERLFLEVWTDGTMSPIDAISLGAGILIEQLSPFVEYVKISQMKAEAQLIRLSIPDEKYNMLVEQLDLSVRTMNCLRRSGITTVGELISKKPKELLKLRNFGQKSFLEIEERLKGIGLSLAPQVELKHKEGVDQTEDQADLTTAETGAEVGVPEESEEQTGESAT